MLELSAFIWKKAEISGETNTSAIVIASLSVSKINYCMRVQV